MTQPTLLSTHQLSPRLLEGYERLKGTNMDISHCECDADYDYEAERYIKTSRHCPLHDDCTSCMERLGAHRGPSKGDWLCEQCKDEWEAELGV